jgi:hypothetical protein
MPRSDAAPPARLSTAAIVVVAFVSLLAILLWTVSLATLASLGDSDAAGNGLAEAFAAFEIILLWVVLAALLIACGINGAMPWQAASASAILLPASGIAAFAALELLSDHTRPPFLWPIVVPAIVPPMVMAFGFWALLPSLRTLVSARTAGAIAWTTVLLISIAVWPMMQIRDAANQREADAQAKWATDFAALAPDAPLWEWTPFLGTRNETRVDAVLQHINKLDRRQADAEAMLDRGDFPLLYLAAMQLDPTQAVCDKTRALLRRQAAPLVLKTAGSKQYAEIAIQVEAALAAMNWLSSHGCPCGAEARAWEEMANSYRDPNYDVVELRELGR